MDEITIGTCGNCGGPVRMPRYWMSVDEPPRKCAHCGAHAGYGPVIPMQTPPQHGSDSWSSKTNDTLPPLIKTTCSEPETRYN